MTFEFNLSKLRRQKKFIEAEQLIFCSDESEFSSQDWHEIARVYFANQKYIDCKNALIRAADLYANGIYTVASDLALVSDRLGERDTALFFSIISEDARKHKKVLQDIISKTAIKDAVLYASKSLLSYSDFNVMTAENYLQDRMYEEAELAANLAFKKIKEDAGKTSEAALLLARAKLGLNKYKEAENIVLENFSELKNNFHALEILSIAQERDGKLIEALESIDKARSINKRWRACFARAAKIKLSIGDYFGAKKEISEALAKVAISPAILNLAAEIEMKIGNYTAALEFFIRIDEIAPSWLSSLNISEVYLLIGDNSNSLIYKNIGMVRACEITENKWSDDNNLFILITPSGKPLLEKYKFPGECLYIVDKTATYYTVICEYIVNIIFEKNNLNSYKNIVFIGSSKGGFASLIYGALLAKNERINANIVSLAFSPQVRLYPENENLNVIPSYPRLMERSLNNRFIFDALRKFGDANLLCKSSPSFQSMLFFGSGYSMDSFEANLISSPNVKKFPIRFSGHGTLMCYTIPENMEIEALREKYEKLSVADEDMKALGAKNKNSMLDEMIDIYKSGENLNLILKKILI